MSEAIRNAGSRAAALSALLDALLGGGNAEASAAAKPFMEDARPEDLVAAVDSAVARGIAFDALKPAVSRLINLMAVPLKRHRCAPPPGERLFSSLMAENAGLAAALDRGKALARALNPPAGTASGKDLAGAAAALRSFAAELGQVEAHYRKKENVLFPWFETRYPEYRCVRLMWDIQDDARRGLKELSRLLEDALAGDAPLAEAVPSINRSLGKLYFDLNANIFREEYALFPVMLPLMNGEENEELYLQTREYGPSFLDAESIARFEQGGTDGVAKPPSPAARLSDVAAGSMANAGNGGFSCRTGTLSAPVLAALFSAVPVDMTWVDAEDKVRWFSDSPHRIFPRSPAIIGRDVRNCHPGASVGRVISLIESFRKGERDREAFWITMGGRFIHIEYFALRSPEGAYLGVLEASQDLTDKRALEGEKRLAD